MKPNKTIVEETAEDRSLNYETNGILILRSKIFRPTLRREFIRRQSLVERLEAQVSLPVTLISAPTGFGKSVIASQWLDECGHRYGWLSLDQEHNDVHVFLAYLVAVLKKEYPLQTFGVESLLRGTNLPSDLIASTIINDLDHLEDLFVLVLDDYHMIQEERIHEIINGILRYPPEHFHLVLLTRRDPPLKLARLRAQFRLHELRMKDLAFTIDEAIQLGAVIASETPDDQINTVLEKSEGWVTGITVGLMGLAKGIEIQRVLQSMNSRNSVIADLLEEVVTQGLKKTTWKFLVLSSLLDRFSADLVTAMALSVDEDDLSPLESENFIRLSIRRNLFLIPLDAAGKWYRYHHLFRSQISRRVGKYFGEEEVALLFKAASRWFEEKQLLEEALKYAIRSGDMPFAVALFDRSRLELHNTEQFQRLDRLIKMFPEDVIMRNLELLLSTAILQDHKANFSGMREYLDKAGRLLSEMNPKKDRFNRLNGQFHCVRAYLSYLNGNFTESIHQATIGLGALPANKPNFFREFALAICALANKASGKAQTGHKLLEEALKGPAGRDKYFKGRLLLIKLLFHCTGGEAKDMLKLGLQLKNLHSPNKFPGTWMAAVYAVATAAYLNNRLEESDQFYEELLPYRYVGRPFWVVHHLFIACLASFNLGDLDKANKYLAKCKELASELGILLLEGLVYAFEVELALRSDDLERAVEVSAYANFDPHPPMYFYFIPQLTQVKLLLQTNGTGIKLLKELIDFGRERNNEMLLLQALILQASVDMQCGNKSWAKNSLDEALVLSKGTDNIRVFLDYGDPMYHLLSEMAEDQPGHKQLSQILAAFEKESLMLPKKQWGAKGNKQVQLNQLSGRELEILTLVSQGYKNAEIADQLFISLDTVKKHLYHTYQKLYVKNRTGAINKARELDLIPEN